MSKVEAGVRGHAKGCVTHDALWATLALGRIPGTCVFRSKVPLIPIEPGSGSLGVLLGGSPQEHRPRDAGDSAAMDSRLVLPTMPQHEAPGHGQVIAKLHIGAGK